MMNIWNGIGRLTREVEVKVSQGGSKVARYTLAVDRRFKRDGEPEADFLPCVAFGRSADFAEMYLHKGTKIAVTGRIQTGSYTKQDGTRVYTTDIIVENQEFCESKGAETPAATPAPVATPDFMDIPDDVLGELPFN